MFGNGVDVYVDELIVVAVEFEGRSVLAFGEVNLHTVSDEGFLQYSQGKRYCVLQGGRLLDSASKQPKHADAHDESETEVRDLGSHACRAGSSLLQHYNARTSFVSL